MSPAGEPQSHTFGGGEGPGARRGRQRMEKGLSSALGQVPAPFPGQGQQLLAPGPHAAITANPGLPEVLVLYPVGVQGCQGPAQGHTEPGSLASALGSARGWRAIHVPYGMGMEGAWEPGCSEDKTRIRGGEDEAGMGRERGASAQLCPSGWARCPRSRPSGVQHPRETQGHIQEGTGVRPLVQSRQELGLPPSVLSSRARSLGT